MTTTAVSQQAQSQAQYDVRAPPRRRAKGDEADEQPVFLRKAYNMISSCPPEIGGWSEEGDAIVIKDMKVFSEKVIPTAYRHNNFASFVRQLNFYGFRKVRSDSLDKAEWWIFRHPHFLRGQPHLISEIKRSVHFDNATGGKEVSDLKDQVTHLSDRLSSLSAQFERLSMVVSQIQAADPQLLAQQQQGQSKKRKMMTPAVPSQATGQIQVPPVKVEGAASAPSLEAPLLTRQISFSAFDFDYFMMLDGSGTPSASLSQKQPVPSVPVKAADPRSVEMDSDDLDMDNDDDMSVSFLNGDFKDAVTPREAAPVSANNTAATTTTNSNSNEAGSVQDLASILGSLTPELKERFVDKLAEVMGTQIANRLADVSQPSTTSTTAASTASTALSVLPSAANASFPSSSVAQTSSSSVVAPVNNLGGLSAAPMQRQQSVVLNDQGEYVLPSGAKAPEIALPLASAAISAYLISALRSVSSTLNQANTTTHSTIPVSSNCF